MSRELPRQPRRAISAPGRGAHPLLRDPPDLRGRREGAPDTAGLPLLPLAARPAHLPGDLGLHDLSALDHQHARRAARRRRALSPPAHHRGRLEHVGSGHLSEDRDNGSGARHDRRWILRSRLFAAVTRAGATRHLPRSDVEKAIKLKDERTLTALQMQLEYLEYATRYVDSISPDPATKDVLARWTDVLMKLESDPMQLSRELDWVIKKAWIDKFMDRHRLSWRDPKVSLLDLQYHDIRPEKGVYYRLALNDQVDRITDDETIEQAKHVPPQTTRARLRGEFIRQANLKGKDCRVDWVYLKLNDPERETIVCKDPFQSHDERVERLIRSF